jgi:Zn-dependent M28 family amino/carboxypeptidase
MMDERLYKSYQNLTNIIFRISDGTEQGKSRAILLNSHIDSTLPSPGAADDAMSVGIMLDVARVLIHSAPRESWFVGWSIIFCESFRCKTHSALLYILPVLSLTYTLSIH